MQYTSDAFSKGKMLPVLQEQVSAEIDESVDSITGNYVPLDAIGLTDPFETLQKFEPRGDDDNDYDDESDDFPSEEDYDRGCFGRRACTDQ